MGSLVDRYLPQGRASFQGTTSSYPGSLPNQTPLAASAASPFSTQDRGSQMQRAGSGFSMMPGSLATYTGVAGIMQAEWPMSVVIPLSCLRGLLSSLALSWLADVSTVEALM